ncbi:sodium channel activity [Nesidiocoris tenuis]|uniref:Sodium channel activity n=1 Tax=Nesidiocoris tenuis TaxID=355587 RepID=A0ABN7AL82_9HEMI|nr:sodium channel activity [Nesidiocoris tenuis]
MAVNENLKRTAVKSFRKYTNSSTAHGVKYLGYENFTARERLFWLLMVLVHASLATVIGYGYLWLAFAEAPIQTVVENTQYPLGNFLFPAVTLCPANKINRTIGIEILDRYVEAAKINPKDVDLSHVLNALHVMEYPTYFNMLEHLETSKKSLNIFGGLNISEFMLKTLPQCQYLFEECYWRGELVDCCKMFSLQRTEEGYCYAFNSFTNRRGCDWHSIDGQDSNSENDSCYRYNVDSSGSFSGLTVFLKKENTSPVGQDENDVDIPDGVLVLISSSFQHPVASSGMLLKPKLGNTLEIEVTPAIFGAHSSLETIRLEDRNCILASDLAQKSDFSYSEQNCRLECRHEFISRACKCQPVVFYDPDLPYPACDLSQLICIARLSNEGKIRNRGTPDSTCKCWPSCQQIRFEIKIRRNILTFFDGSKRFGMLDVYYSKRGAIKYQKKVSFTVEQLLASIGGTGSLLMGASMISGVEILYYSVRGCIQLLAALVKLYKQRNTPPNVHFLQ